MDQATAKPESDSPATPVRNWKPLNPTQRRVVGVLVEKAKTTPEQYPLSLNAVTNGCNQKNNRSPVTNLSQEQVEQAIDELRSLGAVIEIQGGGRVAKYRHCMYEWLGVDKVELAVMTELLLRGEQTVGELRARAARMEPIADLGALRVVLQSLKDKQLLLELTPEGRGQVVSHNLYKDRELTELTARMAAQPTATFTSESSDAEPARPIARGGVTIDMFNELQLEVVQLRAEVARLRALVEQ
jgi:uncharacterized protein YceH (UPF0502 family)